MSRSPIMRDHRYFDTLATTNTGVRERQAPKNLIPNHAPGFRSEVAEGRDRRNVSAKNTPRKRRSTFSTLTENSGPLPNATVPLFQNGGDRWSPQQSLQTTYGHFEEKSGYHADAGSHNSKRRQRAMTVRYDEGMGHSPNTKFPEDRSTKLSYSPVDSRAPDPPDIPSEYPEDQRIYKASPDTPGGSRTKPRSLTVTHKPVQTNLVEETPPGEQDTKILQRLSNISGKSMERHMRGIKSNLLSLATKRSGQRRRRPQSSDKNPAWHPLV
ncbi:hypothetical protein FS842_008510 [Serendipita sp. 407]|nr:hypothetical protein FS842_008510 [Serendipita sp. 407]